MISLAVIATIGVRSGGARDGNTPHHALVPKIQSLKTNELPLSQEGPSAGQLSIELVIHHRTTKINRNSAEDDFTTAASRNFLTGASHYLHASAPHGRQS